jgi:YbgC/YbaW family acyl-CoA thioester hydrolase
MPYEHTSTRRIEFSETDMAGLVHFSNFFKYMETAERDFFELCGVDLINTTPGKVVGWPRGRADCKFMAPLRFGDSIDIHIAVKAIKDRSIEFQFRIYRHNPDGTRTHAAKGALATIFTSLDDNNQLRSQALPENVLTNMQAAPAEALARAPGT